MTIYFLFCIFAILLLANFLIFRNKSLKVKIIGTVGLLAGIVVLFIAIAAVLYLTSTDPRERNAEEAARYKWLYVKNLAQTSRKIIISYTCKKENKIQKVSDTLNLTTGPYHSSQHMLPVEVGDSTYFPNNFKIQVKDSLNKFVASYNKEEFLKNAKSDDSTYRPKNKMTMNFYVLEINP
ncbi:hypothetical protein [Pedobacter miscanthi]|uniref:Uncharacterized protein n=1 Tax=Pedobacter miscanthi TaxID=2259170 RepID=A0A366L7X8_9SPHI|nr:hypothetical protein [Pedobacter miscanthi]RBQ09985.1 hypothetical protein DRW42_05985 [Pedobacter miscanthi]